MALNGASHNVAGEKTGPTTGQPPSLSDETKNAILDTSTNDSTGQSAPGRDVIDQQGDGKKVKTAKELEKERQKAEKQAKFEAKKKKQQEAQAATAAASGGKVKEKKKTEAKKDALPPYVEETPKGQKKILKPLDDEYHKAYIPAVVESAWYDWWEEQGFHKPEFTADGKVKPAGAFTIPIPPPNVTGALHCGHALATALQDVLIRWHRMRGFTTLYLPGCDHAGISTQSVVEKMLYRKEKKTRHDLGREKFLETVHEWKEEYHQKIVNVLKRLGGSMDWTREAFTMDANLSKAVTETFVRLHDEGLIYRSNRLVNWCTQLNTALSNLEVENKEITGRTKISVPGYERVVEFGVLTYFKYPIDGEEPIVVATTRPETMLGDSGIAVHPEDKRYQHLIGKVARHPFVEGRELPIVADTYVEPEFGTGCVKLTPAHDPNDFDIGKRHNLKFINILNDNGTLNENCGEFKGQKRFDARYTVIQKLKETGLFVKDEDNAMKIPLCEKSKDVIEPLMKPQWWMKMKGGLSEPAIKAVEDGSIKIRPKNSENDYLRWMKNINDWCLSRQLWWGHRCPAYLVRIEGENTDISDGDNWIVGRTQEEAHERATKKYPGKKFTLEQDEDVLDTWFSSGLWPFSTLGWPEKTQDYTNLYPTSVLETGWDILPFWVARMIMLGIKLTGQKPFDEVFCHSLIRDSDGRKMSKSLGNVIDPMDIVYGISLEDLHAKLRVGNLDPKEIKNAEKYQKTAFPQGIPECGTDALRFSLVQYTTGGGDINFEIKVMAAHRRFCNKVYQATKYVLGALGDDFTPNKTIAKSGKESMGEKWILHKLSIATKEINEALRDREFSKSTIIAHKYFYDHLCDVFIEISKPSLKEGTAEEQKSVKDTLYTALEGGLTMLHPFVPFLSEELWQRLPRRPDDKTPSIVVAKYPEYVPEFDDPTTEASFGLALAAKKGITTVRDNYKLENPKVLIQPFTESAHTSTNPLLPEIKRLCQYLYPSSIDVASPSDSIPSGYAAQVISPSVAVYVQVPEHLDVDKEIKAAQDKMAVAAQGVVDQRKILDAEEFTSKSSEEAQKLEKKKLEDYEGEQRSWERIVVEFNRLKLGS